MRRASCRGGTRPGRALTSWARPRPAARARGYAPEECIAVGDSREDMSAAEALGTFWLVANADEALLATAPRNVRACEAGYGAGVYEAVMTELAERR